MNKNRLFSHVLNSLGQGVITINMDGNITWCNKAAKEILKIAEKNIVGRSYTKVFLSEPKNEAFHQIIADALDAGTANVRHKIPYRSPDGKTYPLIITTSFISTSTEMDELFDNQGVVVSFFEYEPKSELAFATNESEVNREQLEELRQANIRLEEEKEKARGILKRIELIKIGLTLIIFILFLGAIMYMQQSATLDKVKLEPVDRERNPGKMIQVIRDTMTIGITLSGPLQPYSTITLAAQTSGKVIHRSFKEGDRIKKDQILY